jgi:hypothetical protein
VNELSVSIEQVEPMEGEPRICQTLGQTYRTALLLTADSTQAEAAVLEGIELLQEGCPGSEELLLATIHCALAQTGRALNQRVVEVERQSSVLPPELLRVLYLPADLRQAFVLRVLVGLSRDTSASLLNIETNELDERTGAAMMELPAVQLRKAAHQ